MKNSELISQEADLRLPLYVRLFSTGLAVGALVNAEMMQWYTQSLEELGDNGDDYSPPRPPRRPNAPTRLGGLALGNT